MFTQKISMDCTKEQYKKFLKEELLKMGYDDSHVTFWDNEVVIANNSNKQMGALGTFIGERKEKYDRTYLGSFNAPLFLALAAMTDNPEGNYGEYFTNDIGFMACPFVSNVTDYFRKATKEEIMAKFGDVKISEKNEYPLDVTCKTDDESCFYATEAQMISYLKSKGYKILKPKTWEEV